MISKKRYISISPLHSVMQADIDPPTRCWYQPCGHLKRIEAYVIEKTRGIGRTFFKKNTPSIGTNPIPYSFTLTEVEQDVKGTTESMISKTDTTIQLVLSLSLHWHRPPFLSN